MDPVVPQEVPQESPPKESAPVDDYLAMARGYLVRIAAVGGAMNVIGREKAIGWMHPEYALRAARAAKRARTEGINASCSSAYRPYGLGIGGFANKRNSRHTFGLACDWAGIGSPGSNSAKRFYQIAKEEGLCNPYGPYNRAEWNHYQLDCGKIVPLGHPIQKTITAKGPIKPETMWTVAASLIGKVRDTAELGLQSAKALIAMTQSVPQITKIAYVEKPKHRVTKVKRKKTRYARHKAKTKEEPVNWTAMGNT